MSNTATRYTEAPLSPRSEAIKQNLLSDLEAAHQLADLLNKENQLLRSTTEAINSELNSVVEAKQSHIDTLEANAIEREAWVKPLLKHSPNSAKAADSQALKAWNSLLSSDQELQQLWDKVEKYVQICQRLNQINGRLIGFRKQRGQRLAEMLFGRPQSDTYSANGQAESSRGSHALVTA